MFNYIFLFLLNLFYVFNLLYFLISFQSPVAASGTVCHTSLRQLRLLLFSESGSKLIFSLVRSLCN